MDVTIELLSDPVPNVRIAAAALLPALKRSIRLPEDVEQLVRRRWVTCCTRAGALPDARARCMRPSAQRLRRCAGM